MGRPLKCPHCGASEANLLQGNIYQCKFCGSIYEYGEAAESIPTSTSSPVFEDARAKQISGQIVKTVAIGLVFLATGIGFIIFKASKHTTISTSNSSTNRLYESSNESNSSFTVVNASAGPQVWTISRRNSDGLTEVQYFLNHIDPVARKVLKSVQIGNTMTWKQSFEDAYRVSALKPMGGVCFVTMGDSLYGYDVHSFSQTINNKTLQQKFSELQNGIGKVEDVYNLDGFKLTTEDGYIYYYLPNENKLLTQDEYDNGNTKTDPERTPITEYGFAGTERQQLYKINRLVGKIFKQSIASSTLDDLINETDSWYKRTYKVTSVEEFTPGEIYFKGNVLYHDAVSLVIAYQTEAGDNATVYIKCFDTNKKAWWMKNDESVQVLKPVLGAANTESFVHGDDLVIIQPYQIAVCLNKKDGNVNWSFKPY